MRQLIELLIRVALFGFTLLIWLQVLDQSFSLPLDLGILIGGVLLVFPVVWIGRKLLDRQPAASRAAWIVTFVHSILMILFGSAIIRAVLTYRQWSGWTIPIPEEIGWVLVIVTGAALLLTVFNLALKGLGAPFAIALSRKLAVDWMYAWTRNPMALALLAFLVALGIWFQSALFVLWVLFLVAPAWLAFLIVFEERELEIRFGTPYLEYKSKTPMLFPRRPKA
jgi:protein-S-isoprenylcysteine O-methyltransferase Ste14